MTHINAYLTFNGNCREAMNFYKHCFGGVLSLQTVEDSPMSCHMPNQMKRSILHATLLNEDFVLMASDMIGPAGYLKGNSVSLAIQCNDQYHLSKLLFELSGSTQSFDRILEKELSKHLEVTDRFGIRWVIIPCYFNAPESPQIH